MFDVSFIIVMIAAFIVAAFIVVETHKETVLARQAKHALSELHISQNYWDLVDPVANSCFELHVGGRMFASLTILGGRYTVRGYGKDERGKNVIYQKTYRERDEAVVAAGACCVNWSEREFARTRPLSRIAAGTR